MRKYKALSRVFLLSYLASIFGGMLFGLLLVKFNLPIAIVMMIICVLDFAAIIVARCMFLKHYRIFFWVSVPAFSVLNLLVISGFILEMIFASQGHSAPYPLSIAIINTVFLVLIDIFYTLTILKIHRKKLIEEGALPPDEEDDI